jgi:preprotein translocase subunit SecG
VIYVLYFVHVLVCIFLILVVLLQQGKGADLSVFGGGSTQTAFGARGATTLLHKLTVASFVIFILTTLAIGLPKLSGSAGSSVMRGVQKPAAQKPVAPVPASKAPATPAAPVQAAPTPVQAAPAPVQQAPTPAQPPG